jgi:hypothetical protein
MGHGNKAANSQNYHYWHDGEYLPIVPGVTTLTVPDSYSFAVIKNPGGFNTITNIDSEWWYGRVLEFTADPSSVSVVSFANLSGGNPIAGTNLVVNAGAQPLVARSTIRFRAVRNAAGQRVWLQIGFQSIS